MENVHFKWFNQYSCTGEHLQSDLNIFQFDFMFVKPHDVPPLLCANMQTEMRFGVEHSFLQRLPSGNRSSMVRVMPYYLVNTKISPETMLTYCWLTGSLATNLIEIRMNKSRQCTSKFFKWREFCWSCNVNKLWSAPKQLSITAFYTWRVHRWNIRWIRSIKTDTQAARTWNGTSIWFCTQGLKQYQSYSQVLS